MYLNWSYCFTWAGNQLPNRRHTISYTPTQEQMGYSSFQGNVSGVGQVFVRSHCDVFQSCLFRVVSCLPFCFPCRSRWTTHWIFFIALNKSSRFLFPMRLLSLFCIVTFRGGDIRYHLAFLENLITFLRFSSHNFYDAVLPLNLRSRSHREPLRTPRLEGYALEPTSEPHSGKHARGIPFPLYLRWSWIGGSVLRFLRFSREPLPTYTWPNYCRCYCIFQELQGQRGSDHERTLYLVYNSSCFPEIDLPPRPIWWVGQKRKPCPDPPFLSTSRRILQCFRRTGVSWPECAKDAVWPKTRTKPRVHRGCAGYFPWAGCVSFDQDCTRVRLPALHAWCHRRRWMGSDEYLWQQEKFEISSYPAVIGVLLLYSWLLLS